ncbi:hypothetical protein N7537_011976 [Penicillium hordei]|uniref:Uncharacterized protein n=1 Tax=Penicillium hordei TaxID=40994 RepID=A0AAD6DMT6_9EURO|nr:uncharacterized protein N7537_011976 [Penicillium hordei]KAJ5589298.1 hypothetical protein N7537_011976 [Penicillium hordei]
MSDGVGESYRFPPIDGLHDRCCNISNERCRRVPLEFIKSPSPRCPSAKPASAFLSELSLHTYVLEPLIYKDFIPHQRASRIATAHRPPTACSPTLLQTLCFISAKGQLGSNYLGYQLGSTKIKLGLSACFGLGLFPARFWSFFFWSISLILDLLSFLAFARLYFSIALSSLTQFFRTFLSLGALCLAIAIVPRLVVIYTVLSVLPSIVDSSRL